MERDGIPFCSVFNRHVALGDVPRVKSHVLGFDSSMDISVGGGKRSNHCQVLHFLLLRRIPRLATNVTPLPSPLGPQTSSEFSAPFHRLCYCSIYMTLESSQRLTPAFESDVCRSICSASEY